MPAVFDEMYQIAGELLLNTSDSQIIVLASKTMMMQNVTKFYNRHKKLCREASTPSSSFWNMGLRDEAWRD